MILTLALPAPILSWFPAPFSTSPWPISLALPVGIRTPTIILFRRTTRLAFPMVRALTSLNLLVGYRLMPIKLMLLLGSIRSPWRIAKLLPMMARLMTSPSPRLPSRLPASWSRPMSLMARALTPLSMRWTTVWLLANCCSTTPPSPLLSPVSMPSSLLAFSPLWLLTPMLKASP